MPAFRDLRGLPPFGRLTVIERGPNKGKKTQWWCQCVCGKRCLVAATHLQSRDSQSCGCLKAAVNRMIRETHGRRHTAEYRIWSNMRTRCYNPLTWNFKNYGGRGITVCERWLHSFENFLADMRERPSSKHSLDRRDPNQGYFPENCRWATATMQGRNTRTNHMITWQNKTACLQEWSEITGFPRLVILKRLQRGWTIEETLTIPPGTVHKLPRKRKHIVHDAILSLLPGSAI